MSQSKYTPIEENYHCCHEVTVQHLSRSRIVLRTEIRNDGYMYQKLVPVGLLSLIPNRIIFLIPLRNSNFVKSDIHVSLPTFPVCIVMISLAVTQGCTSAFPAKQDKSQTFHLYIQMYVQFHVSLTSFLLKNSGFM